MNQVQVYLYSFIHVSSKNNNNEDDNKLFNNINNSDNKLLSVIHSCHENIYIVGCHMLCKYLHSFVYCIVWIHFDDESIFT